MPMPGTVYSWLNNVKAYLTGMEVVKLCSTANMFIVDREWEIRHYCYQG